MYEIKFGLFAFFGRCTLNLAKTASNYIARLFCALDIGWEDF